MTHGDYYLAVEKHKSAVALLAKAARFFELHYSGKGLFKKRMECGPGVYVWVRLDPAPVPGMPRALRVYDDVTFELLAQSVPGQLSTLA